MENLRSFFSFEDPNVLIVTLGTLFLGAITAITGSFAFLRKRALIGDAIAHAILPGIALAFMLSGSKNPWILIIGALISGWISILLMNWISSKSKLHIDTALALVLSVFFGFGILLLTHIQHSGAGNQSGLDQFLFGKAASMTTQDLTSFGILGVITLFIILLFFKSFKLLSFNPDYAKAVGLPVKFLEFLLSTLTVMAITVGIQSVGVVLMAALLITPAAAARSWTHQLKFMLLLAAFFGAFSGVVGTYISYTSPKMPTGPWVVMTLSVFALFSILFAPVNGAVSRIIQQRRNKKKIVKENLLKALYHIGENRNAFFEEVSFSTLIDQRYFLPQEISVGMKQLKKDFLVVPVGEGVRLTEKGMEEGARVVRLHRLWEMYLTVRMNFAEDHVHPNAETIEHIITQELEKELIKELGFPEKDPHQKTIPYSA